MVEIQQLMKCPSLAWGGLLLGLLALWGLSPGLDAASNEQLWFASTGQILSDQHGFLSYWREHNGEKLLGAPITKELGENGLTVQYFERGRLEWHAENTGTILLGHVGKDYATALWRKFDPAPPHIPLEGEHFFEETGHTVREPFLSFWQTNGQVEAFGYPISEPLWEYVADQLTQVQYFERGRLEYHPRSPDLALRVQVSPLGHKLALLRGLNLTPEPTATPTPLPTSTPIPPTPLPVIRPKPTVAPKPAQVPAIRGGSKYIVVNLNKQWLYAYEGDTLILDAPVSTGRNGAETPRGSFAVYSKTPLQTMRGTINGEKYVVPNVPSVMYINGGVAIHGTYWHNRFGSGLRLSHGCINLPIGSASKLYNWAPLGTPVYVK